MGKRKTTKAERKSVTKNAGAQRGKQTSIGLVNAIILMVQGS